MPRRRSCRGFQLLAALVFAPFFLSRLGAARRDLVGASYDVMQFRLFFVGFQFMPWYATWIPAPAALLCAPIFDLRREASNLLCLLAPWLYFPFGWQWARSALAPGVVALLAAVPLLGLLVWLCLRVVRRPPTHGQGTG